MLLVVRVPHQLLRGIVLVNHARKPGGSGHSSSASNTVLQLNGVRDARVPEHFTGGNRAHLLLEDIAEGAEVAIDLLRRGHVPVASAFGQPEDNEHVRPELRKGLREEQMQLAIRPRELLIVPHQQRHLLLLYHVVHG